MKKDDSWTYIPLDARSESGSPGVHVTGSDQIKCLKFTPQHPLDVSHTRRTLEQNTWPILETLIIIASTPIVLEYDASQLLQVQDIQLQNTTLALSGPLASQLRQLEMEFCEPQLQIWPFLRFLAGCTRMERLTLKGCFLPSTGAHNTPSPPPPLASRLYHVEITDIPSTIGLIMSGLIVPAGATVFLEGLVSDAVLSQPECDLSAEFVAMLPAGLASRGMVTCLPALCFPHCTLTAQDTHEECSITIQQHHPGSAERAGGVLVLSLRSQDVHHQSVSDQAVLEVEGREELLRRLIITLEDVFAESLPSLKRLKFIGPVENVSWQRWRSVLRRFPGLHGLSIQDETLQYFPTQALSALTPDDGGARLRVCPDLRLLSLRGGFADESILRTICGCLEQRRASGGPTVLDDLNIELCCSDVTPRPLPDLDLFQDCYRKELRHFAKSSTLHIKESKCPGSI